ncbi:MAG: tetratricopeptide repeat protein, partial [Bacteroidota bacterium]
MSAPEAPSYDTDDFARDVLSASRETPVLVDFWAPWCGPCRVVGPVLERMADEEASGEKRWTLRKVNTDQHPELMQQYGIRGIPAMKLFVDGEVVGEQTGALPEYMLQQWLDGILPTEARRLVAEARQRLADGDRGGALSALEAASGASGPDGEAARELLARLSVFDAPEHARDLVRDLHSTEAEAVRTVADHLTRDAFPEGASREPYAEAHAALARGDVDAALGPLIEIVGRDRAYDDDGARKLIVAL